MLKIVFLPVVFTLLFLAIVIPNSLQEMTAFFMIASFTLALGLVKWRRPIFELLVLYLMTAFVTVFYALVGLSNGAPMVAMVQMTLIYLASPLIWIVVLSALTTVLSERLIVFWLLLMTASAIASVALYYFLFLSFGPDSVRFFLDMPNVNLKDGYAGASMHVYGTLIFLTAGFFSTSNTIRNTSLRVLLLGSLAMTAITSGRSALIVSVFVGLFLGIAIKPNSTESSPKINKKPTLIGLILYAAISALIVWGLLSYYTNVNVGYLIENFIGELFSGGGSERSEQADALIDGIYSSFGLGHGHGVGVSYIRHYEFPWRYELIWIATIFRVGFIGALIYSLIYIVYFRKIYIEWRNRSLSDIDKFLFSGFVAAFLATYTNPYIESFTFQWMFILPVCHIFHKSRSLGRQR